MTCALLHSMEWTSGPIDVGGRAVVLATDPVFVMPSLGFEHAA